MMTERIIAITPCSNCYGSMVDGQCAFCEAKSWAYDKLRDLQKPGGVIVSGAQGDWTLESDGAGKIFEKWWR